LIKQLFDYKLSFVILLFLVEFKGTKHINWGKNSFSSISRIMTIAAQAPPPVLDFGITAEQVVQITNEIIEAELAANNEIAALKPEERTYENILLRLVDLENKLSGTCSYFICLFMPICFCKRQSSIGQFSQPVLSGSFRSRRFNCF
jgi:hypothetical protein